MKGGIPSFGNLESWLLEYQVKLQLFPIVSVHIKWFVPRSGKEWEIWLKIQEGVNKLNFLTSNKNVYPIQANGK